jgi:hypothetical protein
MYSTVIHAAIKKFSQTQRDQPGLDIAFKAVTVDLHAALLPA